MKQLLLILAILVSISNTAYTQTVKAAFESNKNIYAVLSDNTKKQLTFSTADTHPFLLANENSIVFLRDTYGDVDNPKVVKVMKVNCNTLMETTISNRKPYEDGLIFTKYICEVENPTLSTDEKYLYFVTEAYATSGNLIKLDLASGKWRIVSDAMDYELIKKGTYQNMILIGKSQIKDKGRDVYYYLINENNQTLKEFDSRENYLAFRRSILGER